MAKTPVHLQKLARLHSRDALKGLVQVLKDKQATPSARVAAARALLEWAWGRPKPPGDPETMDERQPSDLSTADFMARAEKILGPLEAADRTQRVAKTESRGVRKRDRDSGSTGSSG